MVPVVSINQQKERRSNELHLSKVVVESQKVANLIAWMKETQDYLLVNQLHHHRIDKSIETLQERQIELTKQKTQLTGLI